MRGLSAFEPENSLEALMQASGTTGYASRTGLLDAIRGKAG
jgi:hypothetical protein